MSRHYHPREIVKIIRTSYRQIQYWDKIGFLRPSYKRHGKYRMYTIQDLFLFYVVEKLRAAGHSIQSLGAVLHGIRGILPKTIKSIGEWAAFAELTLIVEKDGVLLVSGEYKLWGLETASRVWIHAGDLINRVEALEKAPASTQEWRGDVRHEQALDTKGEVTP